MPSVIVRGDTKVKNGLSPFHLPGNAPATAIVSVAIIWPRCARTATKQTSDLPSRQMTPEMSSGVRSTCCVAWPGPATRKVAVVHPRPPFRRMSWMQSPFCHPAPCGCEARVRTMGANCGFERPHRQGMENPPCHTSQRRHPRSGNATAGRAPRPVGTVLGEQR